jgi:glutamine synthetase
MGEQVAVERRILSEQRVEVKCPLRRDEFVQAYLARPSAEPPAALEGNAYESDAERFPHSLREAIAALEDGSVARQALGDEVVDHYLNYARTEQRLFDEVVTCYERERMFERG